LAITTIALKLPLQKRPHSIDYLGAVLIVAGVSSLLLYLNWAGNHYGWLSAQGLLLVGASVVLAVLFVLAELRAQEPIIPMRLFHNSIFSVGNAFAFCAGVALFGAAIFLPVYLQGVQGMSPTKSGLAMIPMVVGIFSTSILSGNLITRTGRYKIYPALGSVILGIGLFMFSRTAVSTPYWQIAIDAFVSGAGLGFTMQTVVVAIQNAVDMRDLGTATSSVTFFRQTGAAIGTAVFGAVLSSRLSTYLQQEMAGRRLPPGRSASLNVNNVQAIQRLPEPIKGFVLKAFTHAIDDVFLTGIPFIALAFIIALFLKEIPLRSSANWGSASEEGRGELSAAGGG
jgi:MFS family permease